MDWSTAGLDHSPRLKAGNSWVINALSSFLLRITPKFRGVSSPRPMQLKRTRTCYQYARLLTQICFCCIHGSIQISMAGIAHFTKPFLFAFSRWPHLQVWLVY
jgi:hypothetical protein